MNQIQELITSAKSRILIKVDSTGDGSIEVIFGVAVTDELIRPISELEKANVLNQGPETSRIYRLLTLKTSTLRPTEVAKSLACLYEELGYLVSLQERNSACEWEKIFVRSGDIPSVLARPSQYKFTPRLSWMEPMEPT